LGLTLPAVAAAAGGSGHRVVNPRQSNHRTDVRGGMMTLAPVLFALLVLVSVPALGAEEVKIVGRDFSFDAPASLPAGLTTFVFENPGAVRHEMIIRLLRQGVTEQQIIDAHQAGMPLQNQMQQFPNAQPLRIP